MFGVAALASLLNAPANEAHDAVAISSRVSTDYLRPRLSGGPFQGETFAFANGGIWRGTEWGTSENLDFMAVARTMAVPLASQCCRASKDLKTTKLLIVVYWGTTTIPEHTRDSAASEKLQNAIAAAMSANHTESVHFHPNDACAPQELCQSSTARYAIRSPDQIDADSAMTSAVAAAAEDKQRTQLGGAGTWEARVHPFECSRIDLRDPIIWFECKEFPDGGSQYSCQFQ